MPTSKKKSNGISSWPQDERPRERLLSKGAQALTDAELEDGDYGFRMVVGVSGTCSVADEYFAEVVHRYSLRQAIEDKFEKKVEYVDELPLVAEKPEEKWQLVYNRHHDWKKRLRSRQIRPLTIIVTPQTLHYWSRNVSRVSRAA